MFTSHSASGERRSRLSFLELKTDQRDNAVTMARLPSPLNRGPGSNDAAKHYERQTKMQSTTQFASNPLPPSRAGFLRSRPSEDVVYQLVTVAAILLVLGSLWVF